MKNFFASLPILFCLSLACAYNIVYKTSTGEIYELDTGDVSRYAGQIDITTSIITKDKINVDMNGIGWLRKSFFNSATGTVEPKSKASVDAMKKESIAREIAEAKIRMAILNLLVDVETDPDVLAVMQKSVTDVSEKIKEKKDEKDEASK